MSKIATFKVEVPCDDDVRTEALKPIILAAIRGLGERAMAADAVDGQPLVGDATAFFPAAGVKTFVTASPRGPRKPKP